MKPLVVWQIILQSNIIIHKKIGLQFDCMRLTFKSGNRGKIRLIPLDLAIESKFLGEIRLIQLDSAIESKILGKIRLCFDCVR